MERQLPIRRKWIYLAMQQSAEALSTEGASQEQMCDVFRITSHIRHRLNWIHSQSLVKQRAASEFERRIEREFDHWISDPVEFEKEYFPGQWFCHYNKAWRFAKLDAIRRPDPKPLHGHEPAAFPELFTILDVRQAIERVKEKLGTDQLICELLLHDELLRESMNISEIARRTRLSQYAIRIRLAREFRELAVLLAEYK